MRDRSKPMPSLEEVRAAGDRLSLKQTVGKTSKKRLGRASTPEQPIILREAKEEEESESREEEDNMMLGQISMIRSSDF